MSQNKDKMTTSINGLKLAASSNLQHSSCLRQLTWCQTQTAFDQWHLVMRKSNYIPLSQISLSLPLCLLTTRQWTRRGLPGQGEEGGVGFSGGTIVKEFIEWTSASENCKNLSKFSSRESRRPQWLLCCVVLSFRRDLTTCIDFSQTDRSLASCPHPPKKNVVN